MICDSFFLGATEEQNHKAVQQVRKLYPHLTVSGYHHGYFSEEDDERICELITNSRTDVLWIALGKPRQEEWCVRNRGRLGGVGWLKTCGRSEERRVGREGRWRWGR